jgi:antitoxin component YwqK of YwqJK toxin-antitoxin module
MEQEFVNDKVDGMFVEFREDGSKKSEVRRVNYKKVGTEVWFSEDGSVLKEVVYEKGKKITETEY